jgi:DNA (cytosine-5)-methyltransferase 1
VKGITYKVHADALDHIVSTLEKLGYQYDIWILNSADYGVPQIRERAFIVGSLSTLPSKPTATHSKDADQDDLFSERRPWVGVGTVISDLPSNGVTDIPGHFAGGKHHELLKKVPPGDNYLFFTSKRGHPTPLFEWRSRYWSFLLKLSPELPSWTVQARRSNNMGPFHWDNRILSIEEIKRIQGFPDDWKLSGNTESQWRQIGNAVPCLLAQVIAGAILESNGYHLVDSNVARKIPSVSE